MRLPILAFCIGVAAGPVYGQDTLWEGTVTPQGSLQGLVNGDEPELSVKEEETLLKLKALKAGGIVKSVAIPVVGGIAVKDHFSDEIDHITHELVRATHTSLDFKHFQQANSVATPVKGLTDHLVYELAKKVSEQTPKEEETLLKLSALKAGAAAKKAVKIVAPIGGAIYVKDYLLRREVSMPGLFNAVFKNFPQGVKHHEGEDTVGLEQSKTVAAGNCGTPGYPPCTRPQFRPTTIIVEPETPTPAATTLTPVPSPDSTSEAPTTDIITQPPSQLAVEPPTEFLETPTETPPTDIIELPAEVEVITQPPPPFPHTLKPTDLPLAFPKIAHALPFHEMITSIPTLSDRWMTFVSQFGEGHDLEEVARAFADHLQRNLPEAGFAEHVRQYIPSDKIPTPVSTFADTMLQFKPDLTEHIQGGIDGFTDHINANIPRNGYMGHFQDVAHDLHDQWDSRSDDLREIIPTKDEIEEFSSGLHEFFPTKEDVTDQVQDFADRLQGRLPTADELKGLVPTDMLNKEVKELGQHFGEKLPDLGQLGANLTNKIPDVKDFEHLNLKSVPKVLPQLAPIPKVLPELNSTTSRILQT
eukprot:GHVN01014650.1.p1 GENE.GHVN01014650.1~~GHVN01014650.1.p1  ORF type:complete len:586 (+),score=71.97 GHVN01014650.1:2662-4419(+)